jgi:hypothetical protein
MQQLPLLRLRSSCFRLVVQRHSWPRTRLHRLISCLLPCWYACLSLSLSRSLCVCISWLCVVFTCSLLRIKSIGPKNNEANSPTCPKLPSAIGSLATVHLAILLLFLFPHQRVRCVLSCCAMQMAMVARAIAVAIDTCWIVVARYQVHSTSSYYHHEEFDSLADIRPTNPTNHSTYPSAVRAFCLCFDFDACQRDHTQSNSFRFELCC